MVTFCFMCFTLSMQLLVNIRPQGHTEGSRVTGAHGGRCICSNIKSQMSHPFSYRSDFRNRTLYRSQAFADPSVPRE